jgi:multicomponent Na+:H+ antiporter subunit D
VATAGAPDLAPAAKSVRALHPLPGVMVAATAAMVTVTVGLTFVAGPLYGYTDRAARDLLERTPYIESVFDGPVPAEEGE